MTITPEEIEARQARSKAKYKIVKARQEKRKAHNKAERAKAHLKRQLQREQIKAGLAWAEGKKIFFRPSSLGQFNITCGYIIERAKDPLKESATVTAAYSIKAPHDVEKLETGRGLVAYRLGLMAGEIEELKPEGADKDETSKGSMVLVFKIPGYMAEMEPAIPMDVITSHIKIRAITVHEESPMRIEKELFAPTRIAYEKKIKAEKIAAAQKVAAEKAAAKRAAKLETKVPVEA